jgi:Signal transduction histidine kinase
LGFNKNLNPFSLFEKGEGSSHAASGLGLSMSKKIVEMHGGKIFIENNIGKKGVTVTISLKRE